MAGGAGISLGAIFGSMMGLGSIFGGGLFGQKPEKPKMPSLPAPPVTPAVEDKSAEIAAQETAKLRSLKRRKTATQALFNPLGESSDTPGTGSSTLG